MKSEDPPSPADDWITQVELAQLLGISANTASQWAKQGRLREFEHGMVGAGRRRYSRALFQRLLSHGWKSAVKRVIQTKEQS